MEQRKKVIADGKFCLEGISRYRNEIYGFSILWILLFHMEKIEKVEFFRGIPVLHWFDTIARYGNMGVDMFLFMSGICLYFSFARNNNLQEYYKKRLTRIFFPIVFIPLPLWLVYLLVGRISIWGLFNRALLVEYWISKDVQVWFASFIVVLYLVYPYLYYYLFRKNNAESIQLRILALLFLTILVTVCIYKEAPEVFNHLLHTIPRIPVFLTGCCFGKFVYEKKKIPVAVPVILLLLFFALSGSLLYFEKFVGLYKRYTYWIGGMAFTFALVMVLSVMPEIINQILRVFGNLSYEFYLSHIALFRFFKMNILSPLRKNKLLEFAIILFAGLIWAKITAHLIYKAFLWRNRIQERRSQ